MISIVWFKKHVPLIEFVFTNQSFPILIAKNSLLDICLWCVDLDFVSTLYNQSSITTGQNKFLKNKYTLIRSLPLNADSHRCTIPYSDEFWAEKIWRNWRKMAKIAQIKSASNLIFFSLRQIKSMAKNFFL